MKYKIRLITVLTTSIALILLYFIKVPYLTEDYLVKCKHGNLASFYTNKDKQMGLSRLFEMGGWAQNTIHEYCGISQEESASFSDEEYDSGLYEIEEVEVNVIENMYQIILRKIEEYKIKKAYDEEQEYLQKLLNEDKEMIKGSFKGYLDGTGDGLEDLAHVPFEDGRCGLDSFPKEMYSKDFDIRYKTGHFFGGSSIFIFFLDDAEKTYRLWYYQLEDKPVLRTICLVVQ
jgi:hypothetical protein